MQKYLLNVCECFADSAGH